VSPEEIRLMTDLNQRIATPVDIRLKISSDPRSQNLIKFCRELSRQVPNIQISEHTADKADAKPELQVCASIVYRGVPHGTELAAFLNMLLTVSEHGSLPVPEGNEGGSDIPAMLKLYVSGMCTFCPLEVQKLVSLIWRHAGMRLTIIDAMQFSEMAESDTIRSVPTLILDDQFRWTGSIDTQELLDTIKNRDPSMLSAATLASMIADGNAYQLSDMMLKANCIIPAFIDMLTHEAFSTRLGAMAVAEEIAEKQRDLADRMTAPLMEHFERQPDAVKGDILYILGLWADRGILGFLETTMTGDNQADVKEAAADAKEAIISRHPD